MNEDTQGYLKRWFDRLAPVYDLLEFVLWKMRPQVVEMAAAPSGARVLDVATGTGSLALAFARRGYRVVGLDLSTEMLRVARSKHRGSGTAFLEADASVMPFDEGSFEVSSISFALHDMPEPMRDAVLAEMFRVTRRGGVMMVVDYEIPGDLIHRLFVRFMLFCCENMYVPSYFRYDLEAAIRRQGLCIEERRSTLMGVGRILKCRKPADSTSVETAR